MLSTVTLRKKLITKIIFPSKVRNVQETRMERLAAFVKKTRKDKGLSTLDVERKSHNQITDGYISQIENLYIKNVSPEKLSALAKGLGITEEEIFAVARGKAPNKDAVAVEKFELLSLKFGNLNGEKKAKAEVLIDVLERELDRLENET